MKKCKRRLNSESQGATTAGQSAGLGGTSQHAWHAVTRQGGARITCASPRVKTGEKTSGWLLARGAPAGLAGLSRHRALPPPPLLEAASCCICTASAALRLGLFLAAGSSVSLRAAGD